MALPQPITVRLPMVLHSVPREEGWVPPPGNPPMDPFLLLEDKSPPWPGGIVAGQPSIQPITHPETVREAETAFLPYKRSIAQARIFEYSKNAHEQAASSLNA